MRQPNGSKVRRRSPGAWWNSEYLMGCVVQITIGRLDGYVMFQLFENPMGCYFVIGCSNHWHGVGGDEQQITQWWTWNYGMRFFPFVDWLPYTVYDCICLNRLGYLCPQWTEVPSHRSADIYSSSCWSQFFSKTWDLRGSHTLGSWHTNHLILNVIEQASAGCRCSMFLPCKESETVVDAKAFRMQISVL